MKKPTKKIAAAASSKSSQNDDQDLLLNQKLTSINPDLITSTSGGTQGKRDQISTNHRKNSSTQQEVISAPRCSTDRSAPLPPAVARTRISTSSLPFVAGVGATKRLNDFMLFSGGTGASFLKAGIASCYSSSTLMMTNSSSAAAAISNAQKFFSKDFYRNYSFPSMNVASDSEREKIRDFWLSLEESERQALVFKERDLLLRMWQEKHRLSCACEWCERKKSFVTQEINLLYQTYYAVLAEYTQFLLECKRLGKRISNDEFAKILASTCHSQSSASSTTSTASKNYSFSAAFGQNALAFAYSNSALKHGLIGVAEDLLRNQGRKFLDIMERCAERKLRREFGKHADPHLAATAGNESDLSPSDRDSDYETEACLSEDDSCSSTTNQTANKRQEQDDEYSCFSSSSDAECFEDDEDEEDSYEDDDFLDSEQEENHKLNSGSSSTASAKSKKLSCSGCSDESIATHEDEQLEEIFHLIAAMTFEQRVAVAYREALALETQKKILQEEEERSASQRNRTSSKLQHKERKKNKNSSNGKKSNPTTTFPLFEFGTSEQEEDGELEPEEDPIEAMIKAKQKATEEQRAKQREERAREEKLREEQRKEREKEERFKKTKLKGAVAAGEEQKMQQKVIVEEKKFLEEKRERQKMNVEEKRNLKKVVDERRTGKDCSQREKAKDSMARESANDSIIRESAKDLVSNKQSNSDLVSNKQSTNDSVSYRQSTNDSVSNRNSAKDSSAFPQPKPASKNPLLTQNHCSTIENSNKTQNASSFVAESSISLSENEFLTNKPSSVQRIKPSSQVSENLENTRSSSSSSNSGENPNNSTSLSAFNRAKGQSRQFPMAQNPSSDLHAVPIEAIEASIFASQPAPIRHFQEPLEYSLQIPSFFDGEKTISSSFATPAPSFAFPPGIIPECVEEETLLPIKRPRPIGKRNGICEEGLWNPLNNFSIFDETSPLNDDILNNAVGNCFSYRQNEFFFDE